MAIFFVTEVSYSEAPERHISFLKVHTRKERRIGPARIVPAEFVVDLINQGVEFRTYPANLHEVEKTLTDYCEDQDVGAEVVIRNKFLSSESNQTTFDNLGSLPTFNYEAKQG